MSLKNKNFIAYNLSTVNYTYSNCTIRSIFLYVYINNPKDATRKLLELINEFGKVPGYKINVQKCFSFIYTNNERPEREINEAIPFTITTKRIK